MPPALSPAGRLRSRTSDISDLLRGRHDAKTSTESHLPLPVPTHLAEPATPTKTKGKFSFLARKRKPSAVSPASARTASEAAQKAKNEGVPPVPAIDAPASHLPTASAGPSSPPQKAVPASLPPLSVSPPSLGLPQLEGEPPNPATPPRTGTHQRIPSGIPTATLRNLRPQKSTSFEHSRRSNDSHGRKQSSSSSARPIITISPPHSVAGGAENFHAPRSAPRPPGHLGSARRPSQSGLPASAPTPTPGLHDRAGPDSPTSEAPSATSIQSSMQFPIPPVDGPHTATSYKEESLLRKDHFEIGTAESPAPRRGTVSVSVSGSTQGVLGGSMGRSAMQERQQRRHVSILHFSKPKQEATPAAPLRARRSGALGTDSPSTSGQSGNESTASSGGTVSSLARSKSTSSPGAKKVPPPLMRTWHAHTPPSTGPPTEPLPSPPASASLQPLLLSSISRPNATSTPSPPSPHKSLSSPPSPHKTLPPLPPKDTAAGPKTPESLGNPPPSPARSEREGSPARTPMRQDAVKRVLEDEHASPEELREALRTQTAKYARLMAYLLTLTERHGMEKHEFLRRIDALEQDAHRRERELKGLRWLVANASQSGGGGQAPREKRAAAPPARADSSTLPGRLAPRSRQRSCSESVASPRSNLSLGFSDTSPCMGALDSVRMSIDSPAGSTEEGLYEMQTTISEFIAPLAVSPPTNTQASPPPPQRMSATARLRRSNTLPDAPAHLLPPSSAQKQKQARRTSSPVLPVSNGGSPALVGTARAGASASVKTGLGIEIDVLDARAESPGAEGRGERERDPHARSDSSTLCSLPSLSTLSSTLSVIPETPRTDAEFLPPSRKAEENLDHSRAVHRRLSGSSLSSSTSSGTGSASYTTSSRVSASPSIGQILDRSSRQPEMDAILRKLRAFGHHGSP